MKIFSGDAAGLVTFSLEFPSGETKSRSDIDEHVMEKSKDARVGRIGLMKI